MNDAESLARNIEAILFWRGEAVSRSELARLLGLGVTEVELALSHLKSSLAGRGLTLMELRDEVMLATSPQASKLIETLAKEELTRELGRAGLETLSIILYLGPVPRRSIEYIRGVNCSFILRHLLIRGLIEKKTGNEDQRLVFYQPTFDLLRHLGIENVTKLPHYNDIRKEIEAILSPESIGVSRSAPEQ